MLGSCGMEVDLGERVLNLEATWLDLWKVESDQTVLKIVNGRWWRWCRFQWEVIASRFRVTVLAVEEGLWEAKISGVCEGSDGGVGMWLWGFWGGRRLGRRFVSAAACLFYEGVGVCLVAVNQRGWRCCGHHSLALSGCQVCVTICHPHPHTHLCVMVDDDLDTINAVVFQVLFWFCVPGVLSCPSDQGLVRDWVFSYER